MTLKANVLKVTFGNFSLKVKGNLTVEPEVVFNGVVEQVRRKFKKRGKEQQGGRSNVRFKASQLCHASSTKAKRTMGCVNPVECTHNSIEHACSTYVVKHFSTSRKQ